MNEPQTEYEFDIAVSFAGADRTYVEEVVDKVKSFANVFYDQDLESESWGRDGIEYFTDVYLRRARFAVIFISSHYATSAWPNLERRTVLARALNEAGPYVLPVRLDDTNLEGLLPTTIYLDARRIGIDGVVSMIKAKVHGAGAPAVDHSSPPGGDVPQSPEGLLAVVAERPGGWEYLLYAGTLKVNMDALEDKYRDFSVGYASSSGSRVSRDDIAAVSSRNLDQIKLIVGNVDAVMDPRAHVLAFGAPGEPGDPGRIIHLASRLIAIYEALLDWSASLRGTAGFSDEATDVLRTLSRFAEEPVGEFRRFVTNLVDSLDHIADDLATDRPVKIEETLTLTLNDALIAKYVAKMEAVLIER